MMSLSRCLQSSSLLVLLALAGACSRETPEAKRDRFLQIGKKQLEKHDYAAALIQFKNAAQAKPKDAEPYYQLGLTSLGQGDLRSALLYLKHANQLDPKHGGAQLKIAELESSTNDQELLDDAESRVKSVLALAPDNANALNTLAVTEYRLGRPVDAEAYLREALQKAPTNIRSYSNLAAIDVRRKDFEGAEKILKQAVEAAPKSPDSWLALGRFYVFTRRLPEAEVQFQKAVELTSSSQGGRALMDLGRVQNASGKTDDAEKTFRKLSLFPDAEYKPVHATFLWQQGKTDLAIAEFMALAKKDPKNRDARTRLIAAYLQLDKSSEAERILTEALKKNQRDADALLQRSEVYLGEGNVGKAQADVMEVLRFKPDDAAAHYLFAKALHALGAEFQRRQELSESLRLNPSLLRVRIELAEALIEARSSKIALDVLDAAPPDQKHLLPILAMRNWALISSGDAGGARKGIDEALAQSKAPEFMFQDGILKLNQRNMTGARVALEEVLQKSPGDQRAVQALADSYFAEKKYAAGIAKIKEHVAKQPNSTLLQAYLGQILLIDGDNAGARAAFLAAKKTNPSFQPADVGLAMLDARENKLDSARQILHGLMDGPKPNSLAAVRLGGIELSAQNYPAAIAAFRKAVDLRPNDWVPANELARCLDTVGQPDEALKYAQKAKELAPGSPYTVDALGWALYNKGMYSAAIKELDSLSKGQLPEARYHLAMAYFQAGDVASGRATLITALKMDPQNPAAKLAEKVAADASAVALER